jgi:hypothetical protein
MMTIASATLRMVKQICRARHWPERLSSWDRRQHWQKMPCRY